VLRDGGFVEFTVHAQRRLYQLRPEPIQKVETWLAAFRRFLAAAIEARKRTDESTCCKKRAKRKR
jgi:hypothetical protein